MIRLYFHYTLYMFRTVLVRLQEQQPDVSGKYANNACAFPEKWYLLNKINRILLTIVRYFCFIYLTANINITHTIHHITYTNNKYKIPIYNFTPSTIDIFLFYDSVYPHSRSCSYSCLLIAQLHTMKLNIMLQFIPKYDIQLIKMLLLKMD